MEVITKAYGKIDVAESKLLELPEGLFGFENYTKFALLESEYEPFLWLQSTEEANLAFLIVDPFLICPSYEADIDDEATEKLGIATPEDVIIMTLVTVPNDGSSITANFQGPLVINKKNKKALQIILNDNRWTTKFDILKALKGDGKC